MKNVLNDVPKIAERINEELDGDAVIMAVLRDKQLGVGFTGVRMNKVLLALSLLCYADITENHLVAYSGVLTPEIRDLISDLVEKVKDKNILDNFA